MSSSPLPGRLFIVSAPSGGGKTTLTRALIPWLAEHGVEAAISVSTTTRPPRAGEVEGVHYHFVDAATFEQSARDGDFLEHAEVFGRRYGSDRKHIDTTLVRGRDVILDIDWQGARQVRAQRPDVRSVFILPPSLDELARRLRGRGQDSDEVIAGRMAAARSEMLHYDEYDHVVVNDDFDRALINLAAVFLEPRLRLADQQARRTALLTDLLA